MAVIELSVNDFLPFVEPGTASNPFGVEAIDTLNLVDFARTQEYDLVIRDTLGLTDDLTLRNSIKYVSTSDYFEVNDHSGRGPLLTAFDILFFWDSAKVVKDERLTDILTLLEVITFDVAKNAKDTVIFVDVAGANLVRNRTGTDTLSLIEYVTVYISDDKYETLIPIPTLSGPNAPEC